MGHKGWPEGQTFVRSSNKSANFLTLSSVEREAAAHLLSVFPNIPPEFTIDAYLDERRIGQDALWPSVKTI